MKKHLALILAMAAASLCGQAAKPAAIKLNTLAQKLVESAIARHAQLADVGIAVKAAGACKTIASTDASDLGEACEAEDSTAIASGKATTGKENNRYDITLPLHDATGKLAGAVGLEFKPNAAMNEAGFVALAHSIAAELEKQIPSQAALLTPGR